MRGMNREMVALCGEMFQNLMCVDIQMGKYENDMASSRERAPMASELLMRSV